MPVATIDFLHGIKSGSNFLSQFTSQSVSPGIAAMVAHAAGMPYAQFVANVGQQPEKTFSTPQVVTALAMCGVDLGDLSANNTDLFFKAGADLGDREGPTEEVHGRFRAAQAVMEIQSITAGHATEAEAQCRIICGYDGTNAPLVYTGTEQLDGTPASGEHFLLGECHLNGTEIDGPQDMSCAFNRNVLSLGGGGEQYPTLHCQRDQSPLIRITTYMTSLWSLVGLNGLTITSGSIYLRKYNGPTRVADNQTQHVKLAISAGMAVIDNTASNGADPNLTTLLIYPIASSSTTKPVTITTGVAITN